MIIQPLEAISEYETSRIKNKLNNNEKVSDITIDEARIYVNILIKLALEGRRSDFFFHSVLFDGQVKQMVIAELREAGYTVTPSQGLVKCYFPQDLWSQIKN